MSKMDSYNIARLVENRRIKAGEELVFKTVLKSDVERLKIPISPEAISLRVLIKSLVIDAYELGYKAATDEFTT